MNKKMSFYDLKNRKKFFTSKYKIVTKKGKRFAVAKSPNGVESWKVIGKSKE